MHFVFYFGMVDGLIYKAQDYPEFDVMSEAILHNAVINR